jgi:hypothetical protein
MPDSVLNFADSNKNWQPSQSEGGIIFVTEFCQGKINAIFPHRQIEVAKMTTSKAK